MRKRPLCSLILAALLLKFDLCLGQQEVDDGGKKYFQSHDSDRDGMLDLDECIRALEGTTMDTRLLSDDREDMIRGYFTNGQLMAWDAWESLFEGDPPGRGIDHDPFEGGHDLPDSSLPEAESYEELTFRRHDTNRDGRICRSEAKSMAKGSSGEWGGTDEDLSSEEMMTVDNLFSELDTDLSDTISFDEWLGDGLSSVYQSLFGNAHAFEEYENVEDDLEYEAEDLSFH